MVTYKFPFEQRNLSRGYANIQIVNGRAQIDETNAEQVALAKDNGGVKVEEKKAAPARKKKGGD